MTPKEKAEQLIEDLRSVDTENDLTSSQLKKLAFICSNEVINHFSHFRYGEQLAVNYWIEVEKEISKL